MASYNDYNLGQKLHDLDIPELTNESEAYSARLHEIGLYEYIQENLGFYNISPADFEAGLNDQQRFQVEQSVQQTFVQAEFDGKKIEDEVMIAVAGLGKIRDLSGHLLYSAKAENMQARWAEEYCREYFAEKREQIEQNIVEGRAVGLGDYNNEGGVSYYRTVDTCSDVGACWRNLPQQLDDAASREGPAQAIFDAYDKALDEYWKLLGKFAEGLSQQDVAYWVGGICQSLLYRHRKFFRQCSPKVVATVQPLGGEKVKEIEGWTARTEEKFNAALKATGA